jgi:tetratricopeptide (TPR) repeat protein
MAGVYTDNQPDFSWLHPLETRTFHQCWYPIQQIGVAKKANRNGAVSLSVDTGHARIGVYVTSQQSHSRVKLTQGDRELFSKTVDLAPGAAFVEQVKLPGGANEAGLLLTVYDSSGHELISYLGKAIERGAAPSPATEPPRPRDIPSTDELCVVGTHLEQYRHATRYPRPYWEEALQRDAADSRNNNALGLLELRRGKFADAEAYFRRAIARLTDRNPNPYDSEPYYNLGLALKFQGRLDDAYEAFAKATWNYAWQVPSYYALAQIDCARGQSMAALQHLSECLGRDSANVKAHDLFAAIQRRCGGLRHAELSGRAAAAIDPLDFWAHNEIVLARREQGKEREAERLLAELSASMRNNVQTQLDVAFDYADAGLFDDAIELLERLIGKCTYPMLFYALGYLYDRRGNRSRSDELYRRAAEAPSDYCFPSRLEEMIVLEHAQRANPRDARAFYYLGNLLYDKQRYDEAINSWERSCELDPGFSIPWRNLGIAYFNVRHDPQRAAECYRKAFAANPRDPRLLYEMDQLDKRIGLSPDKRLARLEQQVALADRRDDLTVERVTLYNETGHSTKALEVLRSRRFHPWEGGEGLVSGQYVWSHSILGREALEARNYKEALRHFEEAQQYPENLGEGKHLLTPENHLHYFAGLARKGIGDVSAACEEFQRARKEQPVLSPMTYYRALAERELGREDAGMRLLQQLFEAATRKVESPVTIDYFATSLPNFLLFEDDLQKRNRIDCLFLIGLAHLGLGRAADAEKAFRELLALDVNHLGAQQEMRSLRSTVGAR